jgi:hypothetical protein
MSTQIDFINSLHNNLNFQKAALINEIARFTAKINGLSVDIFEKKNGYGVELRPRTIIEKSALTNQISKLDIKLSRKDSVFYPWPRNLTLDNNELKIRLDILYELATSDSKANLSTHTKTFLKIS